MNISSQTLQQVERAIRKICDKFPYEEEPAVLTDIHVRVLQDSGEILAFDDDDKEITRCVVAEWIDNKDDDFYTGVTEALRQCIQKMSATVDHLGIMKPYSFVLENDDMETVAELYVADDDTIIVSGELMEGLDHELDDFFSDLMKDLG